MKWNNIKTTIFKELRGIIRDKKSLQKLILYPLLIPAIILLFGFMFDGMNKTNYVIGTNYKLTETEEKIIKDMDNITIKSYKNKKELEKAYDKKNITGYIIKDNNTYTIYTNTSQNSGEMVETMANSYLESYNKELGNEYILENNLNPDKAFNTLTIKKESLTSDDSNILTNIIYSLVISYLIMIVVLVSTVVVIDATSGEKERGTLETILTFPVKSSELVFGKYIATALLGFGVGLLSYLLSIPTILIGKQLFKSYEELVFNTNIESILLIISIIFLSALLSAGVCMALSGKAKTYKEAQSSLQIVSFLPLIPYFLKMMEVESNIVNFIPIANCGALLNDIVINKINYQSLLVIIATTLVYTVAILIYISKQYSKEETLFS